MHIDLGLHRNGWQDSSGILNCIGCIGDMVPYRFTLFKELVATLETLFKYPGLPTETLFRRLYPIWFTILLIT